MSGLSSVSDRTLFTRRAPIVKPPLSLLTGSDLVVVSPTAVKIVSASFVSGDIGKTITISGSAGSRNDGTFPIVKVLNSITVELEGANFEIADVATTTQRVAVLANSIKAAYGKHRTHKDYRLASPYTTHVNNDAVNIVSVADVWDLSGSIALLNLLRTNFSQHISNTGGSFHVNEDQWNQIVSPAATNLASAVTLANELKTRYDAHRLERRSHLLGDADSRVAAPSVDIAFDAAPSTRVGPFTWVLQDPRLGTVADSPVDVVVRVNGVVVDAEAVFGMIGAVVLPTKPAPSDSVAIDYNFLNNPPARFLRLNSPEFVLNQDKNNGIMGVPGHKYRARSYMINPGNTPDLISAVSPLRIGWKYKAYEREYSATTNDPAKLLLNSPVKKIKYPVLQTTLKETTIAYDPTTLPQDPWKLEGQGDISIADGLLTIVDNDFQTSADSKPPFYSHVSDLVTASIVSAAFRVRVDNFTPDGVFTGVGFGVSDGFNVILVGFVQTEANNLSSAISMANGTKSKFNAHIVQPMVHGADDLADAVDIVDADDLESLTILLNAMKLRYAAHLAKADPTFVTIKAHKKVDTANEIASPDADDLDTAIVLINELRTKFNAHLSSSGVHFVDDIHNSMELTKQVGILTNSGAYEFQDSWEASAVDWTKLATYRIHRDDSGDAHLYMSGDVSPLASVAKSRLPTISDFGGKFDPVQQVFFGSISREAVSASIWNLIRANLVPLDSNLVEDNKSVSFPGTTTPERDSISPWITLGHGGTERVYIAPPGGLQVDSTCHAQASEIVAMGASSGAFRGFMRFEPMLAPSTTCTVEFSAAVDYYTFGLGNRSDGLFIDDGQLSVHFAFLHYSPSPAQVTGSSSTFSISSSDKLSLGFDGLPSITINFPSVLTTASAVSAAINAAVGAAVASDDGFNHVELVHGLGASSYISVVGGSAAQKLGLSIGKYFGRDSNPEPKISWFSDAMPDQNTVPWVKSGGQSVSMIGAVHAPVMRVTDTSTSDYTAFSMSDPTVVTGALGPSIDWKLDCRLTVNSFVAGEAVPATLPLLSLLFSGVLVNVDEGYGGKNVELHCAVDSTGAPYLNLVSYDPGTNYIDAIAQYPFAWSDGGTHSFNIFTNKAADQLFVYADGVLLTPSAGTPAYSALNPSIGGFPSVTFGSGGEAVSNVDVRTSQSVADWESVAVFCDSKISDPSAASKRYIGIHRGGDPTLLNSWNVASVDWASFHTYRIVRDPINAVSIYLDGGDTPILSVSYDPIRLPPCSSSFLSQIANSRPVVAWGAFDPMEISRTRWRYVNYSMGKLTLTDRIVPPHQVLNQANVMASPDHLRTGELHAHYGFSVYSEGTPEDEFMANPDVPAFTILGERIPPVPKTQNLESRGGLVRSATPASSISALDFMNHRGLLGKFEDDTENVVSVGALLNLTQTLAAVVSVANGVSSSYSAHRVRHATAANVHPVDDITNVLVTPPASDLPTSLARLVELKAVFNSHIADGTYHVPPDASDSIVSSDPVDLDSAIVVANEVPARFDSHILKGYFHFIPSSVPYFDTGTVSAADATDLTSCNVLLHDIRLQFMSHTVSASWHGKTANYSVTLNYGAKALLNGLVVPLANQLKALFNQHISAAGAHAFDDVFNSVLTADAHDVDSAVALANDLKAKYNLHIAGQRVHNIIGSSDLFTHAAISNPLQAAIALANDILESFNSHIGYKKSHVEPDRNVVDTPMSSDLASVVSLANVLKHAFNLHRTAISRESNVHVRNDTVNVIATADATDLDTAIELLNAVRGAYESHRTQAGVHGSAAFIRLEAPSRTLYEGMKFWTTEDGVENLVSPFSDDETWHVESVKYQTNKALVYDGTALPEQATIVSMNAMPSRITNGDTLVLEIDRTVPRTVVFQTSDTTLLAVVNRVNSVMPGVASAAGSEIRLSSPAPGPSSSVILNGGTALGKLGFDIPHHSPWFVVSENPDDVSIAQMTAGGEDFLRYGTSGPSRTMYANMAGYPLAPSIGFDLSVRIRINSVGVLGGEDSGIYVGLSGLANALGFTAAIGWGGSSPNRYVKLQDMNSGTVFDRVPFDWFDGAFHTYNLIYDETQQTLQLSIDS